LDEIVATGGAKQFPRPGDSPANIAGLGLLVSRLKALQRDGYVRDVNPMTDYGREGAYLSMITDAGWRALENK
jgi:hypothetical protein